MTARSRSASAPSSLCSPQDCVRLAQQSLTPRARAIDAEAAVLPAAAALRHFSEAGTHAYAYEVSLCGQLGRRSGQGGSLRRSLRHRALPNLLTVPGVRGATRMAGEPIAMSIAGTEKRLAHDGAGYCAIDEIDGPRPHQPRVRQGGGGGALAKSSATLHAQSAPRALQGAPREPLDLPTPRFPPSPHGSA